MPRQTSEKRNILTDNKPDTKPKQEDLTAPIHQSQILPQTIKQRHIEANNYFVTFGSASELPSGATYTKVFFDTDNNKLYVFNPSTESWVSTTLS